MNHQHEKYSLGLPSTGHYGYVCKGVNTFQTFSRESYNSELISIVFFLH